MFIRGNPSASVYSKCGPHHQQKPKILSLFMSAIDQRRVIYKIDNSEKENQGHEYMLVFAP